MKTKENSNKVKSVKVQNRVDLRNAWLNETRTITALVKFCYSDQGRPYVEKVLADIEGAPSFGSVCSVKNIINSLKVLDSRDDVKRKYLVDSKGNERRLFTIGIVAIAARQMAKK